MYPVFEGEEAICSKCMSDHSPCEICRDKIWNRGFLGFFEGTACFHLRNLLTQKAPHMVEFFNSLDHSLSPVSYKGTSALPIIDEPYPLSLVEDSLRQIYSQTQNVQLIKNPRMMAISDVEKEVTSEFTDQTISRSNHIFKADRKE